MSRHCERPGCSKIGEVIYEVDLRRLLVTIDFPDLTDATPVNLLCRRHADSLTVPKGWTIINNREEVQRLFSAPVTQEATKMIHTEASSGISFLRAIMMTKMLQLL